MSAEVSVPDGRRRRWMATTAHRSAVGATVTTAFLWTLAVVLTSRSGAPTGVFEVTTFGSSTLAQVITGLGVLVFAIVGTVILTRRPANAIGWLFCSVGVLIAVANLAGTYAYHALDTDPGSLPGGAVAEVVSDSLWLPTLALTTVFLFLYFPSGHLATRWERTTARVALVAAIVGGPIAGITEDTIYPAPQIRNPLPTRLPGVFPVLSSVGFLALLVCLVISLVLLVRRYRRSRDEERLQLKWFLYASILVLVTTIPANLGDAPPIALIAVNAIAVLLLPVSVAVAITKYRLLDIEVVIRKTVVYAMLAGMLVALGAVVLLALGAFAVAPTSDEPVVLVSMGAVLGLAISPLRTIASRIADRVVFGGRRTPYEIVTEFAQRVGETYDADDVLPRMANVVARGTGATSAAIWVRSRTEWRLAAVWPSDVEPPPRPGEDVVEIRHQGETLGGISVSQPANDPMTPAKRQLVEALASQSGPVLRNVRLIEDLRASRQRLVAAQDEERRRIERNIHDGAQQQLVALAVKVRLASTMVGKDDDGARAFLTELEAETADALENLRDLARGIYPPLLADKGLVAALEAQARRSPIPVEVLPDGIGRYRPELEAAVYFCVLEALQNVTKYAGASRVEIGLGVEDGALWFRVADDGRGFDPDAARGSGLTNMRDRVEALGGALAVESSPGRGTVVTGRLPLGESPHAPGDEGSG